LEQRAYEGKFRMSIFGFDLFTIIPVIIGLIGGAFGYWQKSGKDKANAIAAHERMKAGAARHEATIAKKEVEIIVSQGRAAEKAIKEATSEDTISKRDHFD